MSACMFNKTSIETRGKLELTASRELHSDVGLEKNSHESVHVPHLRGLEPDAHCIAELRRHGRGRRSDWGDQAEREEETGRTTSFP